MTAGVPVRAGPTYTVPNPAGGTTTINAAATSGINVDNIVSTAGPTAGQYSNIYFMWLTNASNTAAYTRCNGTATSGGCAVKLTQAGLQ